MEFLENTKLIVGIAGSAATGSIWLFKKVIQPRINKRKMLKRETMAILNRVADAIPKIDEIYKEVRPNGGGSLKDIVNSIREQVAVNQKVTRLGLNEQEISYYECDAYGAITYGSASLYNLIGRHEEEVSGSNWLSFVHPADRELLLVEWESSVEMVRNFEHKCRVLNGVSKKYVSVVIKKMPINVGSKMIGFFGTMKPEVS